MSLTRWLSERLDATPLEFQPLQKRADLGRFPP
jgi:hypothetical protein